MSVDASGPNVGAGSPAIGDDGHVYTINTIESTVYLRAYPPPEGVGSVCGPLLRSGPVELAVRRSARDTPPYTH